MQRARNSSGDLPGAPYLVSPLEPTDRASASVGERCFQLAIRTASAAKCASAPDDTLMAGIMPNSLITLHTCCLFILQNPSSYCLSGFRLWKLVVGPCEPRVQSW